MFLFLIQNLLDESDTQHRYKIVDWQFVFKFMKLVRNTL